jgi:ABC-type nitrate/sulfonate/bicarbonate transport system permease component
LIQSKIIVIYGVWEGGMTSRDRGVVGSGALLSPSPGSVRLGIVVLLVAVWEIAARFGDRLFVAPPSAVIPALWALSGDKGLFAALGTTLWELASAFVVASVIGALTGLLIGRSRIASATIFPIVLFLYSLPQAPLLPLFVLAFGIGPASKIAFGISHGIFPMIVTVAAGSRDVDASLLKAAHSMGARRRQIIWSIVLPAATPSLFTGLRLAMSGVLLGVLLAELFVSQAGIGFYTHRFTDSFQPADLFALISMLAALAVALNEICRLGENWFSRWRAEI